MITPRQLFWIRLKRNQRDQLRAWNSVLDWTVWLYLLLPGLFIGGGLYREVLMDMPEWAMKLPWSTLYPIVLLVVLFMGQIRIFVEEADRLFLLQRPEWLQSIKRYGIGFTLIKKLIVVALPYLLLLPFLRHAESMSWLQVVLAYGFTIVMGMVLALSIQLANGKLKGRRKWAFEIFGFLFFGALYLTPMMRWEQNDSLLGLSLAAAAILMLVLLWAGLRTPIQFEAEVKTENAARLRSTELLMSQVIESKPVVRLKRPYLFRASQRLFHKSNASTMLAELRIKAFLRGMTHIRVWLGFMSAATYAVSLVPGPIALFLVAALTAIGMSWLHMQWRQWFAEPFIAQFPWSKTDARKAAILSRFWLLLPLMLVWSAIAGYKLAGIIGILAAVLLCAALWSTISLYDHNKAKMNSGA
ncbi:ABC-2 type transport system permease protein [Paenibacillus endophyticus]|uniref:ABC-2 type transport system permease protein n=1 Tax=Paenibacillus endophyticus TaxID=1294268 RepID=A0A7W5GAW1_9BACL|nr:ABC transporter permease [Paenibacillus endophyticus]MBB3153191.1 ABC-2 type transport system permease protein [Paenibacillus endophyticus]